MNETDKESLPNREDRLMAALAYPFWFAVFPLVYMTPDKRNDPFLRPHVYQGAVLGMAGVVGLSIVRSVLCMVVKWIILFDLLLYPVLKMAEYGVFAFMLYGAVWALRGKRANIPYVSDFVASLSEKPATPEQTS